MRLLLDTHALIWTISDSPKLSSAARGAIADRNNELVVSAVSAMEITTKHRLGKLPEAHRLAPYFESMVAEMNCRTIDVTVAHAAHAGALPFAHGDPFDRLLIAQAQLERMTLVSSEARFDRFGVDRLW